MYHKIPNLTLVKDMFKRFYFVLALCTALACKAAPSKPVKVAGSTNLEPTEQQSIALKTVAELISRLNYKKVTLNDSLSVVIYNRFIKSLDENHNYLLASDIKEFEKFKTVLDDNIKDGDLSNVFYMYNILQKRRAERIKYALTQLDKPYDFTKNETFTYDRDNLPWMASEAEMDIEWSKRVKYDLLNLKLATPDKATYFNNPDGNKVPITRIPPGSSTSPDMAKNKEKLKKRYEDILLQYTQLSNEDVFQQFMDSFTEAIDPHTNYFNPFNASQFNMEMKRSLEGIGATLTTKDEYVTISSLVAGGPADKSHQVNAGDKIVAVAQGKDGEFQDIIGWRIDNAIKLIRGPKGTTVRLKILPQAKTASDKPDVVDIVREKIVLKDQLVKKEIRTYNNNGKTLKIGIINVPAFYADFDAYKAGDPNYNSTTRDMKLILDTLKRENVDGIVVDLRENGGGSLSEAISLTGLFIKNGPVVQVRDTRNDVEVDKDEDPSVAYTGPMAVLTDRFSASASEIFAGAIQDYGRGIIIGTQTYGKGTVQNPIDLDKMLASSWGNRILAAVKPGSRPVPPNQLGAGGAGVQGNQSTYGQLNLTIAKFYRVSGSSTQHRGVIPDIQFPSVIPLDKFGEDTEPSAMPFDVIAKSDYNTAGNFSAIIPSLTKLHEKRMSASASYKYILQDIADYKKNEAEKSVTLNEVQLKKQRDADEQKSFERDNLRRVAMGLQPIKKGDAKPKHEDLDFLKVEAGQILIDYITLDPNYTSIKPAAFQ